MRKNTTISNRGDKASNTALRVDMDVYREAQTNLFHKVDNPNGALILNMAENNLSWHLLKDKIEQITRTNEIPDWVSNYTSSTGNPDFRKAVASFLSTFLTKCSIDSEQLACSAGATPVIEVSSWLLANPGDVAVFPAPSYPVYTQDIGIKSGVERYDLITHEDIVDISDELVLTISILENCLKDIHAQGKQFRMLVLTNPDNPTGGMYTYENLLKITDWCIEHEIHLIVNEIYGLSLINTSHPYIAGDYKSNIDFISFANIMEAKQSDYLHLWYSLSKDFGSSGFRIGLVYSHNEQFLKAYNNINAPHMVSNFTQWVFQEVLSDHNFIEDYIHKNQNALTDSYLVVVKYLREANIPYIPSRGSLFVWIDLSNWIKPETREQESKLWLDIYEKTNVLITPADGFGNINPGHYRLVYTAISKEALEIAMKRLTDYLTMAIARTIF